MCSLRLFLYSLTYCIKEGIKGDIIWRLNAKSAGLWDSYGLKKGEYLVIIKKTDPIVFVLFIYQFLDLLYQRGYQGEYFWILNLKLLAFEAATARNRGIPWKIIKSLIILYLCCILLYCCTRFTKKVSEVRYLEIKWIKCPLMRQIQTETGKSLEFCITLIQLYLLRLFIYSLS